MNAPTKVTLFFRRPNKTGSFSIETSFNKVLENFPPDSIFILTPHIFSHFSRGFFRRIFIIFESRANQGLINHITGDIHFACFGLPSKRTILTIHDCGFLNHSNPLFRQLLKLLWLKLPVKYCRYVTAVSEATKQDILNNVNCDPQKIRVIPTVIDSFFVPSKKVFNSKKPKILHMGLAPNKNLERHIEAISSVDCELVIVGKLNSDQIKLLESSGVTYSSSHNLSKEQLYSTYVDSDILLFASTIEGFGMPILEAQSIGRAVITSNLSSMPEIAGSGACLVDPYNVDAIRQGITKVIGDNDYREELINLGFKNIRRFDIETVVKQYESLYHEVFTN